MQRGIGAKQMPGQPTAWTPYVDVRDVRETIAKAEQAGATIREPAQTFVTGDRFASVLDPFGQRVADEQQAGCSLDGHSFSIEG